MQIVLGRTWWREGLGAGLHCLSEEVALRLSPWNEKEAAWWFHSGCRRRLQVRPVGQARARSHRAS